MTFSRLRMTFRGRPECDGDARGASGLGQGPRTRTVLLAAAAALPAAAAAWIGVTGWLAHGELRAAQQDLDALESRWLELAELQSD